MASKSLNELATYLRLHAHEAVKLSTKGDFDGARATLKKAAELLRENGF